MVLPDFRYQDRLDREAGNVDKETKSVETESMESKSVIEEKNVVEVRPVKEKSRLWRKKRTSSDKRSNSAPVFHVPLNSNDNAGGHYKYFEDSTSPSSSTLQISCFELS